MKAPQSDFACARIHRPCIASTDTCRRQRAPLLFTGTITSGGVPANSPLLTTPGTFNGQTVDFNHIPAFNYFDFCGTVQRQRAFRPDVHGHEPARQEAADRGQHRRHDVFKIAAIRSRRPTIRSAVASRRAPGSSSKRLRSVKRGEAGLRVRLFFLPRPTGGNALQGKSSALADPASCERFGAAKSVACR